MRSCLCRNCGRPFVNMAGGGPPPQTCSPACRREWRKQLPSRQPEGRKSWRRSPRRGTVLCAGRCGRFLVNTPSCLPPGRHTCQACRRKRRNDIQWLRAQLRLARITQSNERRRASTAARGYGTEHQRIRKLLLPSAIGTSCALCGDVMTAEQPLDLDHSTPLRVDPASVPDRIVHASCNRAWRRAEEPAQVQCPICGQLFRRKGEQRTCSRACGREWRRQNS